jgi:hypothetical protein
MGIKVQLTPGEIEALKERAGTGGGFQELCGHLVKGISGDQLSLTPELSERVARYCHAYGTGGWQSALQSVAEKIEQATKGQ